MCLVFRFPRWRLFYGHCRQTYRAISITPYCLFCNARQTIPTSYQLVHINFCVPDVFSKETVLYNSRRVPLGLTIFAQNSISKLFSIDHIIIINLSHINGCLDVLFTNANLFLPIYVLITNFHLSMCFCIILCGLQLL